MKGLILAARLVFGAWMLASGLSHFALHLWAEPVGHTPLAVQLMAAFLHSGLIEVAYGIQLVAGALILAGIFLPVSLCVVMPICVCAAYWSVILEQEPVGAILSLVAVALNALLLLAHLDYFRDMLVRYAATVGEEDEATYESRFVDPRGRTGQGDFIRTLIPLGMAAAFYHFLIRGGSGNYAMLVLLLPAIVLHARRLHDMGKTAWLLLIPAIPTAAGIWFHMYDKGQSAELPVIYAALAISALFTLWGLAGKSAATQPAT
jgi:uncharacterized membrane protein YhaH (DUF805 family)